jgi:hypothetical protein
MHGVLRVLLVEMVRGYLHLQLLHLGWGPVGCLDESLAL